MGCCSSDSSPRSLRWRAGCPTELSNDDVEDLLCVLPAGHGGDCDADQDNEYQPTAEMRDDHRRLPAGSGLAVPGRQGTVVSR